MAKSCIPKAVVEKMKQAIRDGDINIKELYDMRSSLERRQVFESFTSSELAQDINASFEKAIVSKQKDALRKFVENTFNPKQKTEKNYANVVNRINELDKLGVLNDSNADNYLSDLIADVMGVSLTTQEIKGISEKANNLEELFNKPTDDGIPPIEYWEARKKMDDYIASLTPSSNLRVLTSTIGRGSMLFSIKSPLVNIESNTVNAIVQAVEKRVASNNYKGLNGDFALNYIKKVNDIYQKSGYDISRMESITTNQRRLGEEVTSSQGEGPIRKVGQFYDDIVFKQLMGAPDVAFSSFAFADSADLASTKIAQQMGLEGDGAKATALEIFKDATKIKPDTVSGEIVRAQAIADAKYATWTNDGGYGDMAMSIRTAINNATGDIRLGDQLMPFIKTPANVIQAGVDAAGVGAFRGFLKLPEAKKAMLEGNGEPMKEVVRLFIRSGLGLTLATVLSFMFDPEDFIGEYDILSAKERDSARIKNAPYNSIKIGDKYISLDYFGPLASAFVGIMYGRKYGKDIPSSLFQYARGAGTQALKFPGLREFSGIIQDINNSAQKGDLGDITQGLTDDAIGYIRSRTIPAIVNDFARGSDAFERVADGGVDRAKAGIPGLRETLPKKINQITGEPKKSEGFLSTMLFGSRIKKADESKIVTEFKTLSNAGYAPVASDITTSGRMKELKSQLDDKTFQQALEFYWKEYSKEVLQKLGSVSYIKSDNDKKKKELDKIRGEAVDKTLRKFNYKKPGV